MPEGDTLHRLARKLGVLVGEEVTSLELPRLAHDVSSFVGAKIEVVEALGKYLCIHFSNGRALVTHLGMLGRWRLGPASAPWRGRTNVVVVLRTARHEAVCSHAPQVRLLDRTRLHADPRLRALGPDVLGPTFDPVEGAKRVRSLAVPIGEALLDQRAVSGIGNIWKSELLYLEGVHPKRLASDVPEDVLVSLLTRARALMQRAVDRGGPRTTRRFTRRGESPLEVYDRAGHACRVCRGAITTIHQGEPPRLTYFCARCQPLETTPV